LALENQKDAIFDIIKIKKNKKYMNKTDVYNYKDLTRKFI